MALEAIDYTGFAARQDRDIAGLLDAGSHERAFALLLDRYEARLYRLCCALLLVIRRGVWLGWIARWRGR